MALYAIGDIQGCHAEFCELLSLIGFSPATDRLWLVGDLVNRGPASLAVLREVIALGDAATTVLGNHDLHLLTVAAGHRRPHRNDTLGPILEASGSRTSSSTGSRGGRSRSPKTTCSWSTPACCRSGRTADTLLHAREVEIGARGRAQAQAFLRVLYGDNRDAWHDDLEGHDRLRVIVNALTRSALLHRGRAHGVPREARRRIHARGIRAMVRA